MDEWTFHGGRLDTALRAFPAAPHPWVDLSTGLNPLSYPTDQAAYYDWNALPDPSALKALERAAAKAFLQIDDDSDAPNNPAAPQTIDAHKTTYSRLGQNGSTTAHIDMIANSLIAVPGTELGLRLLPHLGLNGPVHYWTPGYRSHAESFPNAIAITADTLCEAADQGGVIILANPNNPDGRIWPLEDLLKLAARLKKSSGTLIVDEAFADIIPQLSLLPHLQDFQNGNVIILRSFGKFYGLGGMRLGFVALPLLFQQRLRHILGSWPLNSAALQIATSAYQDFHWQQQTRIFINTAAQRLDNLCQHFGFNTIGDCPLFRLIDDKRAAQLFHHLAAHGLLSRPFDHNPNWLRLGLPGTEADWVRLEKALASFHG